MPKTSSSTRSKSKPRVPRKSPSRPPITTAEITVVHLVAQGMKYADIEKQKDMPAGTVEAWLKRAEVVSYRRTYEALFVQAMAEEEARKLVKAGVTREDVLGQLMVLAKMAPERTRGSIEGQVDALREIALVLGMKLDEEKLAKLFGNMTDGQLLAVQPGQHGPQ